MTFNTAMLEQKQHRRVTVGFISQYFNVYLDTIMVNDITVWYAGYNIAVANNANLYYNGLSS